VVAHTTVEMARRDVATDQPGPSPAPCHHPRQGHCSECSAERQRGERDAGERVIPAEDLLGQQGRHGSADADGGTAQELCCDEDSDGPLLDPLRV
jgi:hypothetical protein